MTRRTRKADAAADLNTLLRHASPDVLAANAHVAAMLGDAGIATSAAAYRLTPAAAALTPSEHDEQCALFAWAAANEARWPELAMLVAIPNGGYRPMATAARLKAEGVKAGYPDILLDVARGPWHGLRIEMKRRPNKPTPAQEEWITRLGAYGYLAVVTYSAQEATSVIISYLAHDAQEVQP